MGRGRLIVARTRTADAGTRARFQVKCPTVDCDVANCRFCAGTDGGTVIVDFDVVRSTVDRDVWCTVVVLVGADASAARDACVFDI